MIDFKTLNFSMTIMIHLNGVWNFISTEKESKNTLESDEKN